MLLPSAVPGGSGDPEPGARALAGSRAAPDLRSAGRALLPAALCWAVLSSTLSPWPPQPVPMVPAG